MDESSISLAAEAHEGRRHNVQMMHSVLTFNPNHFMTGIKMKYRVGRREKRKKRAFNGSNANSQTACKLLINKGCFGHMTTVQPKSS